MARTKLDIVRAYLAELNDPDIPTQTIARALHKRHKSLFPTIENARNLVRMARGNHGKRNAKNVANKSFYRKGKPAGWNIPEGIEQVLPCRRFATPGRWLTINDPHWPFHDKKKLEQVLNIGIAEGCENFNLNGDGFDFHQISKYERDILSLNVLEEMKIGQDILAQIAQRFSGYKVFKIGNHDARFEKFLMNAVPELARSDKLRLATFLELGAMGYEVIASTQQYMIGDMPVYHGHELGFGMGNPALFARNVFRILGTSLMVGHGHQSHSITETVGSGATRRQLTVHFVGHLGQRQNYRPVSTTTQGYAIVTVGKDGVTTVENRRI